MATTYALATATKRASQTSDDGSLKAWVPIGGMTIPLGVSNAFKHSDDYASSMNVNWSQNDAEQYFVRKTEPYQDIAFLQYVKDVTSQLDGGVTLIVDKSLQDGVIIRVLVHAENDAGVRRGLELKTNGEFKSGVTISWSKGGGEDSVIVHWPNLSKALVITATMRAENKARTPIGAGDIITLQPDVIATTEFGLKSAMSVAKGGWNGGARLKQSGNVVSIHADINQILDLDTAAAIVVDHRGDLGKAPGPDDYGTEFILATPHDLQGSAWCAWRADEICTITGEIVVDRVTFTHPSDTGQAMSNMITALSVEDFEKPPAYVSPQAIAARAALLKARKRAQTQ